MNTIPLKGYRLLRMFCNSCKNAYNIFFTVATCLWFRNVSVDANNFLQCGQFFFQYELVAPIIMEWTWFVTKILLTRIPSFFLRHVLRSLEIILGLSFSPMIRDASCNISCVFSYSSVSSIIIGGLDFLACSDWV